MGKKGRRSRRSAQTWLTENRKYIALVVVASATAGLVVVAFNRPVPAGTFARSSQVANSSMPDAPTSIRFVAIGDSITEVDSPEFSAGQVGPGSWVSFASGDGLAFVGGWADGGKTTQAMADSVTPYDADALVILAGTNDVIQSVSFATSSSNYDTIVATAGVSRVIVVSIPPSEAKPQQALTYNNNLEALAQVRGWEYVDACAAIRTPEGTYIAGYSGDGVHPTAEAAALMGTRIRAALLG